MFDSLLLALKLDSEAEPVKVAAVYGAIGFLLARILR